MAPRESAEELAHRLDREKRALILKREDGLQKSLAPFRVGSVPYLNAVPLTRGLEDEIIFAPPSELAKMMNRDELDAALVSVTEVLFSERYDILDGIAVASLGEVKSVILAHRPSLAEIKEVYCDPASLTSVNLLRVLLGEIGLTPEFKTLQQEGLEGLPDYLLLIGDRAIEFVQSSPQHQILDLGTAWYEMTRLPFVYAVWALRRGATNEQLHQQLREAKAFGLDTLETIIRSQSQFDYDFRKDYLSWHIHYHCGADEKRGLARFVEMLRRHQGRPVFDPRFVS